MDEGSGESEQLHDGPSLVDSASPRGEPEAPTVVVVNGREFFHDLVRHPASWPLPGWLGLGLILVLKPELRIEGRGFDAFILVATLSGVYWLAPLCVGYMTHTTLGLRPPSDTEVGCAVTLLRGGALIALYVLLLLLLRA